VVADDSGQFVWGDMLEQLQEIFLPILGLLLTGSFLILSVIALPFEVYQF
jgi:hypothetical protein